MAAIHVTPVRALVAAIVVLTPAIASTGAADHPRWTDHDDLQRIVDEWSKQGVQVDVAAYSDEGRAIHQVTVGDGPVTAVFLGAMHADEPSGVEAIVDLVWALIGDMEPTLEDPIHPDATAETPVFAALADEAVRQELLDRVTVVAFPMMDPDGIENGHERDALTNVDYWTKATPQQRALDDAVEQHDPDILIDNHGTTREDTEIRFGLVQPQQAPEAVRERTHNLTSVVWEASSAIGADVDYYEEKIFNETGPTQTPGRSLNDVYWDSLTKAFPVPTLAYQLEGVPSAFSEVPAYDNEGSPIGIDEGASIQQATMAGILLERSGLLSGDQVHREPLAQHATVIQAPEGLSNLFAVKTWDLSVQDYRMELVGPDGTTLATDEPDASDPFDAQREARAVYAEGPLAPGEYRVVTEPRWPVEDGAEGHVTFLTPAEEATDVDGVLDEEADVRLSDPDESVYGILSPWR